MTEVMNEVMNDNTQRRTEARQSFTGSRLTDSRFDEAWNTAAILNREIHKSGSFIQKLTDHARTYAGRNKVDASKEEIILRDIYAARYGETLNQTREGLMGREAIARKSGTEQALHHARSIAPMIKDGPTMPNYLAQDRAATAMARQHGITEVGARSMMSEAFEAAEGRSLNDVGKELEATHHRPVREAARAARSAERQSRSRSGPQR